MLSEAPLEQVEQLVAELPPRGNLVRFYDAKLTIK